MSEHKAAVQYESKGKTPDGKPFLTVKKARGYYEYSERGGVDSIAFILFDRKIEKFCLIYESKPPRDEIENAEVRMTTAFGGSKDSEKTFEEICKIEVLEETGYDVNIERINFIGQTLVSTQMSQMCHGYLVDVTNIEKTHTAEWEQETSEEQMKKDPNEFSGNRVVWMNADELIENGDWKSVWIFATAVHQEIIKK